MTYYKWTFLLVCFVMLAACDKAANCTYTNQSYGLISTTLSDALLTVEYTKADSAVFVNAAGEIQSFAIKKSERLVNREMPVNCFEDELLHSYQFNSTSYCLQSESGISFDLQSFIEAAPDMGELVFTESLLVLASTGDSSSIGIIHILIPEDGEKTIKHGDFANSVNFLDKNFKDCYVHQQNTDNLNRLYYNQEVGVVAFDDAHNQLWVFDQFK